MKVPSHNEIIGIVVLILAIVLFLKLARAAIRLVFFVVGLIVVIGVFYVVFMR